MSKTNNYLPDISSEDGHTIHFVSAIADIVYTIFATVYWWGDGRPCHHARAVQQ